MKLNLEYFFADRRAARIESSALIVICDIFYHFFILKFEYSSFVNAS